GHRCDHPLVLRWQDVCKAASPLPQVEESTSYRQPALKVAGKTFACMSAHERNALVVWVDRDERELLLASAPDVYFLTPHYEPSPTLLVRLAAVDRGTLAERLEDAW